MEPMKRDSSLVERIIKLTEQGPHTEQTLRGARRRLEEHRAPRFWSVPFAWGFRAGKGAFIVGCAGFALMFVLLVVSFDWLGGERPLSVEIEARVEEPLGGWVRAGLETKQLRFSDGSAVSLHPHTAVFVEGVTARGARGIVGEGRVTARLAPRTAADWSFRAGPFIAHGGGASFEMGWDPGTGVFELALYEGAVDLWGPGDSAARSVRQGEFVRLETRFDRPSEVPSSDAVSEKHEDVSRIVEVAIPNAAPRTRSVEFSGEQVAAWRQKLEQGDRSGALQSVRRAGVEQVLRQASQGELWSLAQAGRLGGDAPLARACLLSLRSRFGALGETAYLLGKLDADQLRDAAGAIRWFSSYLKEAPGGPLSEQALGRLVELQAGTEAGRSAARRYLERYPRGTYAPFAESQLD